jgi:23S rRNA (uracil1939-C5)-methyltransferase
MAETLQSVRQWWHDSLLAAYRPSSDEGSLQTVTMRDSATMGDRMVILTVSGNPAFALREHHLADFVTHVRRSATPQTGTLSIILRIRQIAKKMPTQFYEMVLFGPDYLREELTVEATASVPKKLCFHISPQAFFQPNTFQAMNIYSHALQLAALKQDDLLFDLYCGIGIFGMFASLETRQAIGIELSRESAYDAKTNAQRLGLSNFSIHCGDTAAVVASLKSQGTFARPSTVIVDPPRAGLSPRAIDEITSLQPSTIVYVSCNPESQARDAVILMQRGWSIEILQPVDQFPQTAHVENIMLARKG